MLLACIRFIWIYFLFSALPLGVVAVLCGVQGMMIVAITTLLFLIALSVSIERLLIGAVGGRVPAGKIPRTVVLCDPCAQVLVTRGLFSKGTVMVSEGFLARMGDEEIQAVLKEATIRARSPALVPASMAALFLFVLLKWVPFLQSGRRAEAGFVSVWWAGMLFPVLRGLKRMDPYLGRAKRLPPLSGQLGDAWIGHRFPGLEALYFI